MKESRHDELLARFARGELASSEARELAQRSLEDGELFEELTSTALAKEALSSLPVVEPAPRRWFAMPVRVWAGVAAASAAVVAGFWLYPRPAVQRESPVTELGGVIGGTVSPALPGYAGSERPVVLASTLDTGRAVFRGQAENSRAPRVSGSVVAVEDGIASIDLGSIDGLSRGDQVPISGDGGAASLTLTDVFRERARGRVSGEAQAGMKVRVPDAAHWVALVDELERMDPADVRSAAEKAFQWARRAKVSAAQVRDGLWKLAAVELRTSAWDEAEPHYTYAVQAARDARSTSKEDFAALLTDLAAVRLLLGKWDEAEGPLQEAVGLGSARARNNAGVLAEARFDLARAEAAYTEALKIVPAGDRQVVESNLSRVKNARMRSGR